MEGWVEFGIDNRIIVVIGFRLYGMERGIDMIGKKITAPLGAASADG
jgi:hypothetical protein